MLLLLTWVLFASPQVAPARAHFERGQDLFAKERYREALTEFSAANEASPRELPDLYFNIGQCHRNLGEPRQAAAALERYLQLKPDAPDRREVKVLIARLRVMPPVASRVPPRTEPTPEPSQESAPVEEPPVSTVPAPVIEPVPRMVTPPPEAPKPDLLATTPAPRRSKAKWVWLGVGLGVVATGLAVGLGVGLSAQQGPPAMMPAPMGDPSLGSTVTFDARGR